MAEKQFVVFKLNDEEYGIEITQVKEIIEYHKPTKIPNTPHFIDGVINVRGIIVPIVSLRKRFELKNREIIKDSRVIIVHLNEKLIGFVVDETSQILRINENDIEAAGDIITGSDRHFIAGIGKIGEKIIVLLNLKEVLTIREQQQIQQMSVYEKQFNS